jgi:hypothetical protein
VLLQRGLARPVEPLALLLTALPQFMTPMAEQYSALMKPPPAPLAWRVLGAMHLGRPCPALLPVPAVAAALVCLECESRNNGSKKEDGFDGIWKFWLF